MSIIKSSLNKLIIKMITRERVLKATECSIGEFNYHVATWPRYARLLLIPGIDGVEVFMEHFAEEGWCKTELRSILHTLFHLNEEIFEYGIYWF